MRNEKVQKLVMTGVFAALSYVVFTFLQIKISLPGGDATSIHLGNAVCVLGALILGGETLPRFIWETRSVCWAR